MLKGRFYKRSCIHVRCGSILLNYKHSYHRHLWQWCSHQTVSWTLILIVQYNRKLIPGVLKFLIYFCFGHFLDTSCISWGLLEHIFEDSQTLLWSSWWPTPPSCPSRSSSINIPKFQHPSRPYPGYSSQIVYDLEVAMSPRDIYYYFYFSIMTNKFIFSYHTAQIWRNEFKTMFSSFIFRRIKHNSKIRKYQAGPQWLSWQVTNQTMKCTWAVKYTCTEHM